MRWAWIAVPVLLVTLLLQVAVADRARLAADREWRPRIAALCSLLGCALPPWREPSALHLTSRDLSPHPTLPGVLVASATFRNDAPFAQPWPQLQLSLQNLDGESLGKPGTHANALAQLRRMSGRTVIFQTALTVLCIESGFTAHDLAPVQVSFRTLTDAEIGAYLHAEQPYDCAGSAKSEGLGIALLDAIDSETPEEMAAVLTDFAKQGWLNLVGGCCGSTPDHIAAIAKGAKAHAARKRPAGGNDMRLSGLESLVVASPSRAA